MLSLWYCYTVLTYSADYRTRIGQCEQHICTGFKLANEHTDRTDLDLRLAHQNFAWIPTWDDHGRI